MVLDEIVASASQNIGPYVIFGGLIIGGMKLVNSYYVTKLSNAVRDLRKEHTDGMNTMTNLIDEKIETNNKWIERLDKTVHEMLLGDKK